MHFEIKGHVLPNIFSEVQCLVFQKRENNMLAIANVQEAFLLHDYAISFDILLSLPPFVLSLIVFT
jgi:hypothetical protein